MDSRPASDAEPDAVTARIALAFATDLIWGPALAGTSGRTDHLRPYWRLFVEGAHRFGTVRVAPDLEAVAVWLPPGGQELDEAGVWAFGALVESALEPDVLVDLLTLFERFEASRAPLAEHVYLRLLATHPDHRGRGVGQELPAADLERWDEAGIPAYLELTNPANDHRYARAGFRPIGGFDAVRDGARVTAMWRPAGGSPGPRDVPVEDERATKRP